MARGIQLRVPRGEKTRPATDQSREAVFSSLGGAVTGARVLDLYAGTGAYGLEALSRGAAAVEFVESAPACSRLLQANLEAVSKSAQAADPVWTGEGRVHCRTVENFLSRARGEVFRWVFADPPYANSESAVAMLFRLLPPFLESVAGGLILEVPEQAQPQAPGWAFDREWRFGSTKILRFRLDSETA